MRRDSAFSDPDRHEFSPDAILPCQFAAGGYQVATPEQRLSLAVLENALSEWAWYVREGRPVPADTRAWFASAEEWWPFSFAAICAHVGLEPDAIRRDLPKLGKPVPQPIPVGALSRMVRAAYGMSQRMLAERLNMDGNGVHYWENEKRTWVTLAQYTRLMRLWERRPNMSVAWGA